MLFDYTLRKKIARRASVCCLLFVALLSGCTAIDDSLHPSLRDASLWGYGIDPHGTTATMGKSLIENGAARIAFTRVAQPAPGVNTWIELTYQVPKGNLVGVQGLSIRYQSSKPLIVKLSQRDFGEKGDNTYAHYQTLLPAAQTWTTATVTWKDFSRPAWTPAYSPNVGLLLENVSAIYLAPDVDGISGGYGELNFSAIEFLTNIL